MAIRVKRRFTTRRFCSACRQHKSVRSFGFRSDKPWLYRSHCNRCINDKRNAYRAANREKVRATHRRWWHNLRKEVFAHYGGACACCGEAQYPFLTIDHVNNDGAAHRREIGPGGAIYKWLRDNGYPEGFQVLCWNCNMAKARYGGVCPHQQPALMKEMEQSLT